MTHFTPEQRKRRARLLRRQESRAAVVGTVVCGVGLVAMFAAGVATDRAARMASAEKPEFNVVYPVELTAEEKKWPGFQVPMKPMDIILHVESYKDFRKIGFGKEGPQRFKNVEAFTFPAFSGRPCEIYLHQGYLLSAVPSTAYSGQFDSQINADTIAHEILHCIVGGWHKD